MQSSTYKLFALLLRVNGVFGRMAYAFLRDLGTINWVLIISTLVRLYRSGSDRIIVIAKMVDWVDSALQLRLRQIASLVMY